MTRENLGKLAYDLAEETAVLWITKLSGHMNEFVDSVGDPDPSKLVVAAAKIAQTASCITQMFTAGIIAISDTEVLKDLAVKTCESTAVECEQMVNKLSSVIPETHRVKSAEPSIVPIKPVNAKGSAGN